jgi:multidrug transporter EmrE-like cation transporter
MTLTVLAGRFFFLERPSGVQIVGMLLGLVSIILLTTS